MLSLKNKIYSILRWSEKYTKTDMLYLVKGSFWLVFSQVLTSAAAFLLAVAYANLLPKETFGIYKYIISISGILGILTLVGMNSAVAQAVARGFEGALRRSFLVQLKWGLLLFFAALAGSLYYFTKGNQVLAISFLIIGSFSPLLNSANTYSAFLNGKKDFKLISFYNILLVLGSNTIIFVTILLTKNPLFIVLAYFAGNTAITLFLYIRTLRVFKPNRKEDPATMSYGKHLSLNDAISGLALYLDGPLVFHFLGAANLAIYSFVKSPPEQIKGLFKNAGSLTLPKFSERTRDEIKQGMSRKIIVSTLGTVAAVAFYIILAPVVFKIFFPKYLDAVFYSQIYALSLIAISSIIPYTSLEAKLAKKELYIYNISTSAIQIGLLVPLIIYFGLLGAVLSKVISRFVNLAVSLILVRRLKGS